MKTLILNSPLLKTKKNLPQNLLELKEKEASPNNRDPRKNLAKLSLVSVLNQYLGTIRLP